MIFDSNAKELQKFKNKHAKEGEFTDEDGVLVLATGYYLGVTLRIISRSNTREQPYTEYNSNQEKIFNIFLDDRQVKSEHFQALILSAYHHFFPLKAKKCNTNDKPCFGLDKEKGVVKREDIS